MTTLSPSHNASTRPGINMQRLRQIFDRRAAAFDEVAFLPREIAQRMHERFAYIKLAPTYVLDAGCGLGDDLSTLQARFASAAVVGLDISKQMLVGAATNQKEQTPVKTWWSRWLKAIRRIFGGQRRQLVQADFAALPFASDTFSLLWSNLALHWHPAPDHVLAEWNRALQAGGLAMFSMLGPDSLRELRTAYQLADGEMVCPRVINFVDMHEVGDMLVEHGFEAPVMDMEMLTITYLSPEALLKDVRRWGAYPFTVSNRPAGLTGRRAHAAHMSKLKAALEAQRMPDGTIPLSIEVIYGHAWKAALKATSKGHAGHATVRVDEIGRAQRSEKRVFK